jgi:hypothetical protein
MGWHCSPAREIRRSIGTHTGAQMERLTSIHNCIILDHLSSSSTYDEIDSTHACFVSTLPALSTVQPNRIRKVSLVARARAI